MKHRRKFYLISPHHLIRLLPLHNLIFSIMKRNMILHYLIEYPKEKEKEKEKKKNLSESLVCLFPTLEP